MAYKDKFVATFQEMPRMKAKAKAGKLTKPGEIKLKWRCPVDVCKVPKGPKYNKNKSKTGKKGY